MVLANLENHGFARDSDFDGSSSDSVVEPQVTREDAL
jgi:hypothetical protein